MSYVKLPAEKELDGWIQIIQHSQAWPQFQNELHNAITAFRSKHPQVTRSILLGGGCTTDVIEGDTEEDRKAAIAQTAIFICIRDYIGTYTVYRET